MQSGRNIIAGKKSIVAAWLDHILPGSKGRREIKVDYADAVINLGAVSRYLYTIQPPVIQLLF